MLANVNKFKAYALALFLSVGFFVIPTVYAGQLADPFNTTYDTTINWGTATNGGNTRTMCQSFKAAGDSINRIDLSLAINSACTYVSNSVEFYLTTGGCEGEAGSSVLASHAITSGEWTAFTGTTPTVAEWDLGSNIATTLGTTYYLSMRDETARNLCYYTSDNSSSSYFDGTEKRGTWTDSFSTQTRDMFFRVWSDTSVGTYATTTPQTTIITPSTSDVISATDIADGLHVLATSDQTSGTTIFNWYFSHYGIDEATGTLANNVLYSDGSSTFEAARFDLPSISVPSTCSGFSSCQYTLGVGACVNGLCGSYDLRNIDVVNSASSVSGGSTSPLNTTSTPFPAFTCSGSITDLCVGYALGTWVPSVFKWLVVPPTIGAFDVSPIFDVFQTRWPLAYVFGPIGDWQNGYAAGTSCPFPTFLGNTIMGNTMPTFDFCAKLADIGPAIDGNTFGANTIQWAIYLGALFMVWRSAEQLHKSHKK